MKRTFVTTTLTLALLGVAACKGGGADSAKLIPDAATMVGGIDVKALVGSKAYTDNKDKIEKGEFKEFVDAATACNLGTDKWKSIAFGADPTKNQFAAVISADGIGKEDNLTCINGKVKEKSGKDAFKIEEKDGKKMMTMDDGGVGYIVNEGSIVVATKDWAGPVKELVDGKGKSVFDGALKDVDAMLKGKKMPAAKIYDEIMKSAVEKAAAPPAGGGEEEDKTVYKVDPGEGPSFGPKNAPVTIVEFSDFQCPFCSRVVPTIKKIKETYGNKVRVVWRNYPLPFHQDAKPAAEAAMAAGAQGKFWEMHDKLFENQRALDRASLEKYAAEIGIDVSRFKADLDAGRYKAQVDGDFNYGNSLPGGGMGTPTFFINGRKIAGAYPFEKFDSMIKEALAAKK